MPPRDELLLIIDLTSTIIRAGVGVKDLIDAPKAEVSTRVGRRPAAAPFKMTDYVVGQAFVDAEAAGEELEVVLPMSVGPLGLEVHDWTALEAIMRYVLHVVLALPRPPLAHPVLLSLPPHLPPVLVDTFNALLFERLLVPSLLIATRPFLAAAAAGVLSAVIVDLGARGEGSEVSVVHESSVVEATSLRMGVDEGTCDDWAMVRLLEEDPELPLKLAEAGQPALEGPALLSALGWLLDRLKADDAIGAGTSVGQAPEEELDIAQVMVDGKADKLTKRKGKDKKSSGDAEGDFVEVPDPHDPEAEPIKVGPARHRYLEPLFAPQVLDGLRPSRNEIARRLGMERYENREVEWAGLQEVVGVVVGMIADADVRRQVWEAVVVVSSGKIAGIKALGPSLVPLLSPFGIDPESGSEAQPRLIRFAKIPDYFSEFKQRSGELGVYLGGCIVAKILVSDVQSKLFVSKADYTSKGPATYRLLEMV